jgi:Transposase DDE domain group 1
VKYAIHIPTNENLERDVAELLLRLVGRPNHKPIVWYKGFLYRAASWTTARSVVAKVEHHAGQLFPRIGFIVTNLKTPSRAVLRFYNKRGTAEQWMKEGNQAVKMARLAAMAQPDCLQLGKLVAEVGVTEGNQVVVADQFATTAGNDRRAVDQACSLLLAAIGREPYGAAPVRKHAEADRGFVAASRIGAAARRNESGRRRGVDEEVSERSLRNGVNDGFWGPGGDPAGHARDFGMEKDAKRLSVEANGDALVRSRKAKWKFRFELLVTDAGSD